MTNDEFLNFVFRNKPQHGRIFTVSFPGDPAHGDYRFTPFLPPTNNNFFCVSTLSSTERRVPQAFVSLHVLVVDDVGTKVVAEDVWERLGQPTYVIETSADNHQWGYVLTEPVTDRATAEGLVQALCRTFTADVAGVNRLVRLPIGVNGKPAAGGFESSMLWHGVTHSVGDMTHRLGASPVDPAAFIDKPFLPPERDPVLLALNDHVIPWSTSRDPGVYKIQCPWVHEHSGGRDDGTAYLAPAGFRCWHGHCADRTFADLRRYLGLTATEVDEAIVEASFGYRGATGAHSASGGVVSKDTTLTPQPATDIPEGTSPQPHPWAASNLHGIFGEDLRLISRAELYRRYPRYWLFDKLIPLGTPWAIAGEGGLGKSRLGLAMCMSVATGVPLGDSFIPDPEGHPVLFLTQEDDQTDRHHRAHTQFERLAERDPRWRSDKVAHKVLDNLYLPDLRFGQLPDRVFTEEVSRFAASVGPFRLVLYDPLTLFFSHESPEEGINTAAGVIHTFGRLIVIARQFTEGPWWSCGMMHHMTKTGREIYGSVMIVNHVRTLFEMTEAEGVPDDDFRYVQLECVKTNSTNKKGSKWLFELDGETASVYPREGFAWENDEEKLAAIVRSHHSITATDLKKAAKDRGLGDVTALLGQWRGQPEKMRGLGIGIGKHNRFESVVTTD